MKKKKTTKQDPTPEPATPSDVVASCPADLTPAVEGDIKEAITTNQVLKLVPEPEEKPLPPRSPVVERLLVRYDFTDHEIADFGRNVVRQNRVIEALEAELASIKTNYKAKTQSAEAERDRLSQIVSDGFEMRELQAFALISIDKKERAAWKVYYRADNGAFVRKEQIPWTSGVEFDMFTMLPEGHVITEPLPPECRGNLV